MSLEMDEYAAKRMAFVAAQNELSRITETIVGVGTALKNNAERFTFSNSTGGFPSEAIISQDSVTVDGNVWLTAARINELLAKLHTAKHEMNGAWGRLPAGQKEAMQPPPVRRSRY